MSDQETESVESSNENNSEHAEIVHQSGFDRFIEAFASKNLDSRIKWVAFFLVVILVTTLVVGSLALGRSFKVTQQGEAKWEGATLRIVISEDKTRFIADAPRLVHAVTPVAKELKYSKAFAEETTGGVFFVFNFDVRPEGVPDVFPYELELQNRTYFSLLMEKSDAPEFE